MKKKRKRKFKKVKEHKNRNPIIVAAFNKEVNLSTRVEKDKKKYSRKQKYKEEY